MPNLLAKSILNNISKKELKSSTSACTTNNSSRLSDREEVLLAKLISREIDSPYQRETMSSSTNKAITLEDLVLRCQKNK